MTSRLRQDDDVEAHRELAHERHVAHLEAAIDETNSALGWLRAWPNQITNGESELETVVNTLRVALRRARPDEPPSDARPLHEPPVYSFDADGDVRQ